MISNLLSVPDDQFDQPVVLRDRHWQWAKPQVEGVGPSPRGGHTATLYGSKIYIFGGHNYGGSEVGFQYFNDIHVLDVEENQWSELRCQDNYGNKGPEPRYGHSACLVSSRIIIFGGKGANNKYFRDLHALDLRQKCWMPGPSSGGAPSARHEHSCVNYGTRLLIFGGAAHKNFFGDFHSFDLHSLAWAVPETLGPKPSPRYCHGALMVGSYMLIHGGFALPDAAAVGASATAGSQLRDAYLNDLTALDVPNLVWARVQTSGSPQPSGRFGHTLSCSDNDIVIFGGWSGAPTASSTPVTAIDEGALEGEKSVDYLTVLRTTDTTWQPGRFIGNPPGPRYGHTATVMGPHVVIFGGWDGSKALAEIVVLRDRSDELQSSGE